MKNINFKALIDRSVDGYAIYDAKGVLIYKNAALSKITSYSAESHIGESIYRLSEKNLFSSAPAIQAFKEKKTVCATVQHQKGGQVFCSAIPVLNENGTSINYLVVHLRDISSQEQYREELEQSKAAIEAYRKELSQIRLTSKAYEKDGLITESPAMCEIIDTILRLSSTSVNVMLLGETGVGKTALASFIHAQSVRAAHPFIAVNCGALPAELLESEFFGHEKGSFSGAVERKIGLFEAASKGTILLDEIGELPAQLQVKLLSVLQSRQIRRVGGIRNIDVDVRIISATNQDLHAMMEEGKFRKDLFYRLNLITLEIPPLRNRTDDIIKLISWFLHKYNTTYGLTKKISPETFKSLLAYSWPGNVRELDHTIERMVILSNSDLIEPKHLPQAIQQSHAFSSGTLPTLKEAVEACEKSLFAEALKSLGTTREIGRALGISNATASRKLNKYGL